MKLPTPRNEYRLLLDRKLTELALYAKELPRGRNRNQHGAL